MVAKSEHEIEVIKEFVKASGRNIDVHTIESRNPPEPDIYCIAESGPVYFELARLLDKEMQKMKNHAYKMAPVQFSCSNYNVRLPELEILNRKIQNKYETDNIPIELVLYYDNSNWRSGEVPVVHDFASHAEFVMRPLVECQQQFGCVWVFERHSQTILWQSQTHDD